MEFEKSSLFREVTTIINSGVKPVHALWTAVIHAAGMDYAPLKILSIDFSSNYEEKYADEIIIELAISGGTYAKRIYPFKGLLDITLTRNPLNEVGVVNNQESPIQTERYTATIIDKGNPLLEANGSNSPTEDALNLTNIFNIQFQLVNKALEQLRMISVGGIYRNVLVEDMVKAILTNESKIVVVEGIRLPKGVNMVPASNKTIRDHVIIPQGTLLVNIPDYIHNKCGGVYSSGLSYYLQGDYWHVYPCYDTTRFTSADNTLTIINVPTNKFPSIEKTYRLDGKNLVVLATGKVKFRDDSETQQLNFGNGVRFADATKFMTGFTKTVNNKTVADRGTNNSELVSVERKSGNNNVKISSNAITANPLVEYSNLARRQGSILSFVWENSQPSLLFPGMMVKVLYLEEDVVKEVYGVALKAHHYVQTKNKGMTDPRHITNTSLSVFVKTISSIAEKAKDSYIDSTGNTVAIIPPVPSYGSASNLSGPPVLPSITINIPTIPSSLSNIKSIASTATGLIDQTKSSIATASTTITDIKGAISNIGSASAAVMAIQERLKTIVK